MRTAEKSYAEGCQAKKEGNLEQAKANLLNAFRVQKQLLHESDPRLAFTLNELMNMSISLSNWKEALYFAHYTLKPFEEIYPPNWPLVGLQYFIYGKLSFYLQNTDQAFSALQKALTILLLTHGEGHSLVKQLKDLLREVEAEHNYEKANTIRRPRLMVSS